MFSSLDIFKTDSDGSVLWRGTVESVAAAKARIQELALSSPGEYLILDPNTGSRIRVTRPLPPADSVQGVLLTAGPAA